VRWGLNTRVNGGARRYADLNLNPAAPTFNISVGSSKYDGVNFGIRRRMDRNVSLNAWYSLSKATGRGGQAVDELTSALVQDATDPLGAVMDGPAGRTDARHRVTVSAVVQLPWGVYASPIFRYRSALPLHISAGYDVNNDGANNDIFTTAYAFTGVDDKGNPSYKEIGSCETINCGRGSALSQLNLRVSKVFRLPRGMNVEAIFEGFNLFNAINPAFGVGVGLLERLGAPVGRPSFFVRQAAVPVRCPLLAVDSSRVTTGLPLRVHRALRDHRDHRARPASPKRGPSLPREGGPSARSAISGCRSSESKPRRKQRTATRVSYCQPGNVQPMSFPSVPAF
jgi:hypothetical protein